MDWTSFCFSVRLALHASNYSKRRFFFYRFNATALFSHKHSLWFSLWRETERSRRGTPCCTYRCRMWILAGCVRKAHPVFYFVLNLLTHGSQPYFSNFLPARRLESNLHNAILFGIRRAFPDLAFDGFFGLIVAGIAGVDYSGHRRASIRSVWGWM